MKQDLMVSVGKRKGELQVLASGEGVGKTTLVPEIVVHVTGGTNVGKTTVAEICYIALRDAGFTDVALQCRDSDATGKGWQRDVKGSRIQGRSIVVSDQNDNHNPRRRG
jgi:hypothetical protein